MRRIAGALVLVALAGACSEGAAENIPGDGRFGATEQEWTGTEGPTVVMLGDSITHLSRDALHTALSGYQVRIAAGLGEGYAGGAISAGEGEGVYLMAEIAADYAELDPDVAILALGTNDSLRPDLVTDATMAAMGTIVELFDDACIVGVRVNAAATAAGFDQAEAATINDALAQVADEIVDVEPLAAAEFDPDGIHPPPEATAAYAALVADAVGRCTAT